MERQIELAKSILESAGYTVTLKEDWPPVLNKLDKYSKNRLRKELSYKGYDIENFDTSTIQITNGRDTRLKSGMTIADFGHGNIAVFINGETVIDCWIMSAQQDVSKMSWKKVLELNPTTYYMPFDAEGSSKMRAKQGARKAAQSGMIKRYNYDSKDKPYHAKLDKSGYVIDPKKYTNMLAELNITKGTQILQQAKEVYVELANNLDKVDWEDRDFYDYETVMRGIMSSFKELNRSLKDYNESGDEWRKDWHKPRVMAAIQDIQKYMKKAERFKGLGN